jgi:hypothetical protein
MGRAVKIKIYKTRVKPALVFGSETWAVAEMDLKRLSTWERKILRKMYGPVAEQGIFRRTSNQELKRLY